MYSTLIGCDDLAERLDNPAWRIFDCRYDLADKQAGHNAYRQSHIPGAVYVDLHDDLSGPPLTNRGRHPLPTDEAMQYLFSGLGINPKTQVIVYDDAGGSFAARLWWMLRHMGHAAVAVLDGGWQTWTAKGLPDSDRPETREPDRFEPAVGNDDVVLIDQVEDYERIIDSRDPARYRGEVETIDKVAGHIPGAINRFWKDNLQENGEFKPKQLLRQDFEQLFEDHNADEVVFYCGSGVTACHNLLAVAHAGIGMPMLYAGSWSEWSSTPGKIVATGDEPA